MSAPLEIRAVPWLYWRNIFKPFTRRLRLFGLQVALNLGLSPADLADLILPELSRRTIILLTITIVVMGQEKTQQLARQV